MSSERLTRRAFIAALAAAAAAVAVPQAVAATPQPYRKDRGFGRGPFGSRPFGR